MRFAPAAFALCLWSLPIVAGETAWTEIAPDVHLRLISSGQVKADGSTLIGLEIDMPPSTKTYWRVPGETGLPTELDFDGSSGVDAHAIAWPFPERDETGGYLDYVYHGPTVLPVTLTVSGEKPHAMVAATLGICSDICIPAQAQFVLDLTDEQPDRANGLRLRQAMAETPLTWTAEAGPVGSVTLDKDAMALSVVVDPGGLYPDTIIAATADGEPLFGVPQKSREPNLVLVPILGDGHGEDLVGRDVELTFMTQDGAFEVERTIEPPSEP